MLEQFPLPVPQESLIVETRQVRRRLGAEGLSEHPRLLQAHSADTLLVVAGPGFREDAAGPDGQFCEGNLVHLSGGMQAKAELVAGQDVTVNWHRKDRWGRLIGAVWVASPDCRTEPCPKTLNAGLALSTSSLASHFKRYAHDEQTEEERERYAFAEVEARAKRAGLWVDPNPVQPWEWRRR